MPVISNIMFLPSLPKTIGMNQKTVFEGQLQSDIASGFQCIIICKKHSNWILH